MNIAQFLIAYVQIIKVKLNQDFKIAIRIMLKNWLLQKRTFPEFLATNRVYWKSKLKILSGPFQGMKYVENSKGGAYFPKLLGTYEKELNPILHRFFEKRFAKIVNVGGGEGYFSVGLANRFKGCPVEVFEPDFFACYLIEKLANLNNVTGTVKINAQLCNPSDLENSLEKSEHNFIFMDVEGAELELLDPTKVPSLKNSSIIVEIHDTISPILGETIKNRLFHTHSFHEVWAVERNIHDLTISMGWKRIFKSAFLKLMNEGRGSRMRWFVFEKLNR